MAENARRRTMIDDVDDGDGRRAATPARRKRNSLLEWLIVIAVAMTSALVVRAFVVQQFAVDGTSMMTTLHNGDRVLVNKLSYRLHDPTGATWWCSRRSRAWASAT